MIQGTVQSTGEFAPTSTGDTYAILDTKYIRGGWRNVSGTTERNAITYDRRSLGMIVGTSDGTYWRLLNNNTGDTTDSDWTEFNSGGENYWNISGNTLTPLSSYTDLYIPNLYISGLTLNNTSVTNISTDSGLTENNDSYLVTQKAIKAAIQASADSIRPYKIDRKSVV